MKNVTEKKLVNCSSTAQSTLQMLTEQVVQQMKKYPQIGTKPWDYQIAAKDLPCQVGSLLKLIMQLNGERYRHNKTDAELKLQVADELADILSLVLFISHELDINMEIVWSQMLSSDEQKFTHRITK